LWTAAHFSAHAAGHTMRVAAALLADLGGQLRGGSRAWFHRGWFGGLCFILESSFRFGGGLNFGCQILNVWFFCFFFCRRCYLWFGIGLGCGARVRSLCFRLSSAIGLLQASNLFFLRVIKRLDVRPGVLSE
jgi:hypothetical protein